MPAGPGLSRASRALGAFAGSKLALICRYAPTVRIGSLIAGCAAALACAVPASAHAAVSLVSEGTFSTPIYATAPRADADTLYVVERGGTIRLRRSGQTLGTPFLTIPDVDTAGEGGLLSVAFSPDYSTSGLFYVYLTPDDANPGAAPHAPIQIREYRRLAGNPDVADPSSGRVVLTVAHPNNANHYGGTLQFGPDGRLYVGTGDGGGGGDPGKNAQNLGSLLGKVLRLDPRPTARAPYGVPADNPYLGGPVTELIWSHGLRNPFRFSFDRTTGELAVGDVGQARVEEVDLAGGAAPGRGLNFGWSTCEGDQDLDGSCAAPGLTAPVFTYDHPFGCSITGGVVSRDPGLEELAGRYLYGDFCRSDIRSVALADASTDAAVPGVAVSSNSVAAFGEDACGRVYVVQLSGSVGRLADGSASACSLRGEFTPAPGVAPTGTESPPPPASAASAASPALGGKPSPLVLRVRVARRQRALAKRRLTLVLSCQRPCSLLVSTRLAVPGPDLRLKTRKLSRRGGRRVVRLPIGVKSRRAIRRALRGRKRVGASIVVRARDASGATTSKRYSVRIVG